MRNVDVFGMMLNPVHPGIDLVQAALDMIDEAIGILRSPKPQQPPPPAQVTSQIREDFVFVAMPMDDADPGLDDVLDAIKETCHLHGLHAERVDDPQTNDRITDRMLESIANARFVIADLTNAKPNVYYEAGYAHALGKIPIYIARYGTKLEFDLKDYPIILFKNYRGLKERLGARLVALSRSARRSPPTTHAQAKGSKTTRALR